MSTCSSYAEFRHKAPTDNDLHLTYNSGLLPLQPNGDMDRENGILKSTAVATIILNLKNSGIIPTLTNTDLFIKKQNDLMQNVKSEYCFYYSRYSYSLQKLLKAISDSNTVNINKYLEDSNISLTKFMYLNQSGKTIKNYRKKLKNTKKHKIKKHIKTKKKIFRYNKFTRKT